MEKIIRIDDHSGLVLEGGGMRGVFTCGVLDSFMDRGIRFPYTIGVSAGACNGLSYMSGQRGRAKYSNIDLLEKYNYIGLKYLLKKRNIMDFDLLFQEFPEHILPYDYEAYLRRSRVKSASLILCVLRAVCRLSVPLPTWTTSRCWMEVLWTVSL